MKEVIQDDREAAASLYSAVYKSWGISLGNAAFMREGSGDHDPAIQAFRRHRTEALAAQSAEIERKEAERVKLWNEVRDLKGSLDVHKAANGQLRKDLGEALEALKPFAAVAERDIGIDEADSDTFRPMQGVYNRAPLLAVGDLRKALALLSRKGDEQ